MVSSLQLVGPTASVRLALASLYYLPPADWYGVDTLTVTVTDSGTTSSGGNGGSSTVLSVTPTTTTTATATATATLSIVVEAVDDVPMVRTPSPYTWTQEDTSVTIDNVRFIDRDLPMDGVLHVTIQAAQGSVVLNLGTLNNAIPTSGTNVRILEGTSGVPGSKVGYFRILNVWYV